MPARKRARRPASRPRGGSEGGGLRLFAGVLTVAVVLLVGLMAYNVVSTLGAASDEASNGSDRATVLTDAEPASKGAGTIVIGLNGDADTYVLQGEEFLDGGAHAASEAGILTASIQTSGSVDTSQVGDYEVTYSVSDAEGYEASVTRTVHVVDSMDSMEGGLPVLMYHYVYDPANPPEEAATNNNYLSSEMFEQHLAYLTENDFYYPSWPEVKAFLEGTHTLPAKSVVLTFDDGEDGFLTVGAALLEKYQVPATSFVIGVDDDTIARMAARRCAYVEYESHSANMHQAGGTIGHGGIISAMTKDEIVADLQSSQAALQSGQAFAYPFGDVTDDGMEAVSEAGVLCAFTTQNAWAHVGDDVRALPRVRISGNYTLDGFIASVSA